MSSKSKVKNTEHEIAKMIEQKKAVNHVLKRMLERIKLTDTLNAVKEDNTNNKR